MLPAHAECSAQSRTCHGTQKSQRISVFGSQRKQTAVSDNLQHSAKTNYDIHNLISLDYKQDSKTSQYTHPFLKETLLSLTIISPPCQQINNCSMKLTICHSAAARSSTTENAGFCTWVGTLPDTGPDRETRGQRAAVQKGMWGCW